MQQDKKKCQHNFVLYIDVFVEICVCLEVSFLYKIQFIIFRQCETIVEDKNTYMMIEMTNSED